MSISETANENECVITDLGPKVDNTEYDDNETLSWFKPDVDNKINKTILKYGLAILAGIFLTIIFFIPYFTFRSFFKNIYLKSVSNKKYSKKELDKLTKSATNNNNESNTN